MNNSDMEEILEKNRFSMDEEQKERIFSYLELIHKWNNKISLVSRNNTQLITYSLLLDTIYMSKLRDIDFSICADLGCGSGIIGIPIAILFPKSKVYLVDRSQKKISFLNDVASRLGIENCNVVSEDLKKFIANNENKVKTFIARGINEENVMKLLSNCRQEVRDNRKFIHITRAYFEESENLIIKPEVKTHINEINRKSVSFLIYSMPINC
jgi:16S rRNA (guanine527-N7)-methyltransferase